MDKLASPHRFFLVFGTLAVVLLALLTPPFQTPDEQQHLLRAYQLSELKLLPARKGELAGDVMPTSIGASAQAFLQLKVRHAASPLHQIPLSFTIKEARRPLKADQRSFQEFLTLYFPTGYAPQVAGVWIGRALGQGPVGLLLAARLVNGLVGIGIIWLGLRLMPAGAPAALFVAMTPTSLAALGSASPDGIVIATAILLAAFAQRAVLGRPALWGMAGSVSALCVSKFAYMPLAAAGAAAGRPKARAAQLALAFAAGVVVLAWLKLTAGGIVELQPNTSVSSQSRFVIGHPLAFAAAVGRTLMWNGVRFRMEASGVLGWLNVYLPAWIYALAPAAFAISMLGPTAKVRLPELALAWWALLAIASALLVFLAMYLPWTPVGYPVVLGFQGRYFVPLLPLIACGLAAVLSGIEAPRLRKGLYAALLAFLIVQAAAAVYAIVTAFGIFS